MTHGYDGVSPGALATRLLTPELILMPEVTSVLDELHRMAAAGSRGGAAVLADRQTRGRGRMGRTWHSPPGTGIWLGYLVRPGTPETGLLGLRVGIVIAEILESLGARPSLKWPNDVLLDGRKVCGVLCEARWSGGSPSWVAVGIGLNVHGPVPGEVAGTAAALDEFVATTRVAVLERLLPRLRALEGGAALAPAEQAAVARLDWLHGRLLAQPVRGVAAGIDPGGALLVDTDRGSARVTGGTIALV